MRISKCRLASAVCAAVFAMAIGVKAQADDAKCQDGIAKGSRNVGNQTQKKNRKCIKDGSGNVTGCVTGESDKAIIKRQKLVDLIASTKCTDPSFPAFGANSNANDIADDTEAAANGILQAVWGNDGNTVDGVVGDDKCSDKIAKRGGKKFDTLLKAFRGCVKDSAPLGSVAAVNGCIATAMADTKAQVTVQGKLDADVAAQCGTIPPAPGGTDDGFCGSPANAGDFSGCVGDVVDCEACLAMNNSNAGTADCDMLDDGAANSSCPPVVAPPSCPIASNIRLTNTQTAGGTLKVSGLAPFPFPAGGTIIQDTQGGTPPQCVSSTVVPFPGGFSAPTFCIPALVFTVKLQQTGCGIGRIDSNGGSDFKVTEIGDTSAPSAPCGLGQACTTGVDADIRVDITVGGGPGTCSSGTANALVTVPVQTTTWQDVVFACPDPDDNYDPGTDALITSFPQVLDFTTDNSSADFADTDPDGCCIAGSGPASHLNPCAGGGAGGPSGTGTCVDLSGVDIAGPDTTTVATGAVGSNGFPLYDLTFISTLPNAVTTSAYVASVCGSPPAINYAGTATRCIDAP